MLACGLTVRRLADNTRRPSLPRTAAGDSDKPFCEAKIATARFYADHILVRCGATIVDDAGAGKTPLEAF